MKVIKWNFFHVRNVQKGVPWAPADLKIRDLAVGTRRIRAVNGTQGGESWLTEDITKNQHLFYTQIQEMLQICTKKH